jgi:hypothetical protein
LLEHVSNNTIKIGMKKKKTTTTIKQIKTNEKKVNIEINIESFDLNQFH